MVSKTIYCNKTININTVKKFSRTDSRKIRNGWLRVYSLAWIGRSYFRKEVKSISNIQQFSLLIKFRTKICHQNSCHEHLITITLSHTQKKMVKKWRCDCKTCLKYQPPTLSTLKVHNKSFDTDMIAPALSNSPQ